jgi:Fe-S cluster assembly protein SufD
MRMRFIDITHDAKRHYRLTTNEETIFFMFNRSGDITFDLSGENAAVQVFAFFTGSGTERALRITQRHTKPRTRSRTLVKAALEENDRLSYEGLIRIEREALESDASQECRSLLLSPTAEAIHQPALEILADAVRCRHAATASPANRDSLFFMRSRGLSKEAAEALLVTGFFRSTFDDLRALGIVTHDLEERLATSLLPSYAR